ncbi:hypothetical protein [Methylobacterium sp. J-092]|uniref:hypothetical protein n=1 Tax=Methylobacterium sp. J-092 TaxID=2836667 RepID=UPI001FBA0C61|nr:hypothetical protein [Methylobacterium sp. J-092]MCJ2010421.1 hypothetical protein [Methylobacterium sp. J-092]
MSEAEPKPPTTAHRISAERINTFVQTLAIIGAGAWGVYTFIYEARIKPSLEPPAVSVTTHLEKAGERNNRIAIRSTVTRKNVGQTGVRVLGLVYNVIGIRAQFKDSPIDMTYSERGHSNQVAGARDYTLDEPGTEILYQGRLFAGAGDDNAESSDLNPGEAVSRDLIVYADRTKYDFVRFEVRLAYTKDDDLPVRLRFEINSKGNLTIKPATDCETQAGRCERLKATDYGTEFSLW